MSEQPMTDASTPAGTLGPRTIAMLMDDTLRRLQGLFNGVGTCDCTVCYRVREAAAPTVVQMFEQAEQRGRNEAEASLLQREGEIGRLREDVQRLRVLAQYSLAETKHINEVFGEVEAAERPALMVTDTDLTALIVKAQSSHMLSIPSDRVQQMAEEILQLREENERLTANYSTPQDGMRHMNFSCPHCGEPLAVTTEREVDIHSGAVYSCEGCKGEVIFSAQTPDQYSKQFAQPTRQAVETWRTDLHNAPKDCLWWLVPKSADETYADRSGRAITSDHAPYLHRGAYGSWSALSKATAYHVLPSPPATETT